MLNQRKLGNQGLLVSEMALGCMGMTGAYGDIENLNLEIKVGIVYICRASPSQMCSTKNPESAKEMSGRNHIVLRALYSAKKNGSSPSQ